MLGADGCAAEARVPDRLRALRICITLASCLVVLPSTWLRAQTSPVTRLAAPTASLPEGFAVIASVRELSDGRVLVSDEKDGRLVVTNFASGSVVQIGRRGAGPGEYRQIGRIWPLSGDTTLVKEPFSPRWLLLHGSTVAATLGPDDADVRIVGLNRLLGVDARGHLVWSQFGRDANNRLALDDSLLVVRLDRASQRVDTIARVQSAPGWSREAGVTAAAPAVAASGGGAPRRRIFRIALSAPDEVVVFPDGWVALVRAHPYRVDWCAPAGRCVPGQPLAASPRTMSDREKRAYLAVAAATQTWPPTTDLNETAGWPNALPPFATPTSRVDASPVIALTDGRLLVERLPTADVPHRRYDILTRSGGAVRQLQLELAERIVGSSERHLYVAAMDEDGIQRLRRHPLP
jgi:hypothetical protein